MRHLILVSSFFLLAACSGQVNSKKFNQVDFPLCEEVLTFVIKNLHELPTNGQTLSLAKKPEGYFLAVLNYTDRQVESIDYVNIWDSETRKFRVPKLSGIETQSAKEEKVSEHFANVWNTLGRYDFQLYHGYPNSSIDIIEALENTDDLSLVQYELLARAYSNQSNHYIHPMMTGTPPAFARDFGKANYEKISEDRLNSSLENMEKAMFYWEKILETDPNYEPYIITDIQLKVANEKMHFWLQYLSIQEPQLAGKMLDKVDYAKADLDVAKRMLDNCEKNGFLFTNGDNDSFPLWYVQEKYGYRKDVVVMNVSLMQTFWYLSMCKARHNYKTSLTSEDYENYHTMVVVPYSEGEISLKTILEDSLANLNGIVPKEGYILVPRDVRIDLNQESSVKLEDGSYLYMWELALLDIVLNNQERTIASVWPGVVWNQVGLKNHNVSRATVSQLSFNEKSESNTFEQEKEFLEKHLEKVDLKQANNSMITQFELGVLVGNIASMKGSHPYDYENIGSQLINRLNIDDVASIKERPSLISGIVVLCDDLNPSKGIQLREKYRKQAMNLINSLDDSGGNFLEKKYLISTIFTIYTGKQLFNPYADDGYNESENDRQVVHALLKKLKTIASNATSDKMIRTAETIVHYILKLETESR